MVCARYIILVAMLGVSSSGAQEDSFLITKPVKKKKLSTQQLKRALGEELEQLAHTTMREISLLAKSQEALLDRVRELLDDSERGVFTRMAYHELEAAVATIQKFRCQAELRCQELGHLGRFLTNKKE